MPSRLVQQGVELAQSLITRPSCKRAVGQGCEREAGYMLLGALCTCLPPATLQAGLACQQLSHAAHVHAQRAPASARLARLVFADHHAALYRGHVQQDHKLLASDMAGVESFPCWHPRTCVT